MLTPPRTLEDTMAQTSTAGMTGKPLIESDRAEGTNVYDPKGQLLLAPSPPGSQPAHNFRV